MPPPRHIYLDSQSSQFVFYCLIFPQSYRHKTALLRWVMTLQFAQAPHPFQRHLVFQAVLLAELLPLPTCGIMVIPGLLHLPLQ